MPNPPYTRLGTWPEDAVENPQAHLQPMPHPHSPGPAIIIVYLACTLWGAALGLAAGFGLWHTATQADAALPPVARPIGAAQTATAVGPTTP